MPKSRAKEITTLYHGHMMFCPRGAVPVAALSKWPGPTQDRPRPKTENVSHCRLRHSLGNSTCETIENKYPSRTSWKTRSCVPAATADGWGGVQNGHLQTWSLQSRPPKPQALHLECFVPPSDQVFLPSCRFIKHLWNAQKIKVMPGSTHLCLLGDAGCDQAGRRRDDRI